MARTSKILLISDDSAQLVDLKNRLTREQLYEVFQQISAQEGLDKAKEGIFEVIILKLGISGVDIIEMVKNLRKIDHDSVIIVYGSHIDPLLMKEIMDMGIYAHMNDLYDSEKWLFLIDKGVQLHFALSSNRRLVNILQEQNISLQKQNALLARRIEESTRNLTRLYEDLRSTYMQTIKVLAQTIDARDHYTHSHSENVKKVSVAICEEMKMPIKEIEVIAEACELHDLGKIGVEDSILGKDSGLSEQEWSRVKCHPQIGASILEPLPFLTGVTDLIKQHHERFDGSGYPEGRKGEEILLGARIIHLADAYESMRSARSYRQQPLPKDQAIQEIRAHSGTQFDPAIVEVFLRIADKIEV